MWGEPLSLLGRYRIERVASVAEVCHRNAGGCHPLLQEPDILAAGGSPKSCTPIAQCKRRAVMELRELAVPPLLTKPLTPALHLLLSLHCGCSLKGPILTGWFALQCCYEHARLLQ